VHSHNNNVPWFAEGTDERTGIVSGGGDLERDFFVNNDCWSLHGSESDCRLTRDLDLERDLELHFDLSLDLIGDRDRERRSLSLERRLQSEERRRANDGL